METATHYGGVFKESGPLFQMLSIHTNVETAREKLHVWWFANQTGRMEARLPSATLQRLCELWHSPFWWCKPEAQTLLCACSCWVMVEHKEISCSISSWFWAQSEEIPQAKADLTNEANSSVAVWHTACGLCGRTEPNSLFLRFRIVCASVNVIFY